jgi:hypothetical protein
VTFSPLGVEEKIKVTIRPYHLEKHALGMGLFLGGVPLNPDVFMISTYIGAKCLCKERSKSRKFTEVFHKKNPTQIAIRTWRRNTANRELAVSSSSLC